MEGGGSERSCFKGQCKLTTSNKQGHPTVLLGRISLPKALIVSEIRIMLNSDEKLTPSLVKRHLRLSQHGNNSFSLRGEKCLYFSESQRKLDNSGDKILFIKFSTTEKLK